MADSLIERCNNFFTCFYNDLSNAVAQGSKWVSSGLESMADGVTWIWGVLKGDWGGERSDSQIIADSAAKDCKTFTVLWLIGAGLKQSL